MDSKGSCSTGSGTWSLQAGDSQVLMDPDGLENDPFLAGVGQDGLGMKFDIDDDNGDLGFSFIVNFN